MANSIEKLFDSVIPRLRPMHTSVRKVRLKRWMYAFWLGSPGSM